jgi:membrane-associated phospholipid phosphatase
MTSARTSPGRGPLGLLARYLSTHALLAVTAIVGGLVILGLTAASAGVYDAVAEKDGVSGLDRPTLHHVIAMRTPLANQLLTVFTDLGGALRMTLIASAVTLLMVWRWRSPTPLILMIIAVAGSLSFTYVGKAIVGRARPPLSDAVPPYEHAFSFPSGHTLNSTVIAGMVAYFVASRLKSPRHRPMCRPGRRLGSGDGVQPDLPRPPLADRRDLRLVARLGLARPLDHRAPNGPRRPPRRQLAPPMLLRCARPATAISWHSG